MLPVPINKAVKTPPVAAVVVITVFQFFVERVNETDGSHGVGQCYHFSEIVNDVKSARLFT